VTAFAVMTAEAISGLEAVSVVADKSLVSVGTEFTGTDSVYVEGKDTSAFYAATNTEQSTTTTHSKSTAGTQCEWLCDCRLCSRY
jgi:hypothetical protein